MESDQFLLYAGGAILALIIYYLFIQWAHQIHKRNRYMEAQINLLSKIAEKSGVNKDEVNAIIEKADKKYQPLS